MDAAEALARIAQGWHGPDLAIEELGGQHDGLRECVDDGLVRCFVIVGDPVRLADDVLPRDWLYMLTEKGRARYHAALARSH